MITIARLVLIFFCLSTAFTYADSVKEEKDDDLNEAVDNKKGKEEKKGGDEDDDDNIDYNTEECSPYNSEANINELVLQGKTHLQYVETKILKDNVDVSGWHLCRYNAKGGGEDCVEYGNNKSTDKAFLVNDTDLKQYDGKQTNWNNGAYLSWEKPINASEGQVVLLDGSPSDDDTKIIDFIHFCSQDSDSCESVHDLIPDANLIGNGNDPSTGSKCGNSVIFDDADGNLTEILARLPDGDGAWASNTDPDSPIYGLPDGTDGTNNSGANFSLSFIATPFTSSVATGDLLRIDITVNSTDDELGSPHDDYSGLITLSISDNTGAWSTNPATGISADPAQGDFTDASSNDGLATYRFDGDDDDDGDEGTVSLYLSHDCTNGNNITVTLSDQYGTHATSTSFQFTCGVPGSISSFNCVEPGDANIHSQLLSKQVNTAFTLDLIAINTETNSRNMSFAADTEHLVNFELVDASSGGTCASLPAISPTISGSLLFTAANAGLKNSGNISASYAHANVKCRLTDTGYTPAVIGCSDAFAIRPNKITISSDMNNTGSTGSPVKKAGAAFTLNAVTAMGYSGTPLIDNSKILAHAGAIQNGILSNSFNATDPATGIATNNSFSYSEVGLFKFLSNGVYDANFTGVDQAAGDCIVGSFSNTPDANGKIGCNFGNTVDSSYFGRFTPDHFDISANSPSFNTSCSSFSYQSQPIRYAVNPSLDFTAKNIAGDTTQNYSNDYFKVNSAGLTPSYTELSHTLTILNSAAANVTDNNNGTGTISFADTSSDILSIDRGVPEAAFAAEIAMSFNLIDNDNIAYNSNPVAFGSATAGNGISFNLNKAQRWGRLALDNAHGSELNKLTIPVIVEYYDGNNFITNTEDNCTVFSLVSNFSISDPQDNNCSLATQTNPVSLGSGTVTASPNSLSINSGVSNIQLSPPGAGNTGSVHITSSLTNYNWLKYDWDNNIVHDNCPSAKATFGVYSGNDTQIFFQEVF